MKNTNEQILELSKLVDTGRLSQEEFDVLKKEALGNSKKNSKGLGIGVPTSTGRKRVPMKPIETKSASVLAGKYSADSDTPMSRKVLKPINNSRAKKYTNYVREEAKEPECCDSKPFNPYLFLIEWMWNIFYISIPIMFFIYH